MNMLRISRKEHVLETSSQKLYNNDTLLYPFHEIQQPFQEPAHSNLVFLLYLPLLLVLPSIHLSVSQHEELLNSYILVRHGMFDRIHHHLHPPGHDRLYPYLPESRRHKDINMEIEELLILLVKKYTQTKNFLTNLIIVSFSTCKA